jgi:hypothetical protein
MRNWSGWFYSLTDEQTHRPEIRIRLFKMQDGRCAMCGAADPEIGDHCHDTGFVRGLLCGRCNRRAWYGTTDPAALAYIADPPAAGLNWLWDLPDWWELSDSEACQAEGVTVTAYILARPGEAQRRAEAASTAAGAVLAAIELPVIPEPEPRKRARRKAA